MDALVIELERRWQLMFMALAAGEDVPPSQRLRTEGMMEAAALQGLATTDQLVCSMAACYRAVFERDLVADFGEDWQAFYPFPQIPAMGRRAPVYPTTSD
jgi:hypothetical protein